MKLHIDTCPTCGQNIRVWRKRIISTAAASLCRLVYLYRGEALHLDAFTVLAKDRNFSQLKLWRLVRPEENSEPNKRSSGMWHPTELGVNFVYGTKYIPKYAVTKNNILIRYDPPEIGVAEALNFKFDYGVLLSENFRR